MQRVRSALVVCLFLLVASAGADDLRTLGKSVKGTLEKITDREIVLQSEGSAVATPLQQVLDLTLRPGKGLPGAEKYHEVQLLDDSILRCTKVTFGSKEALLELTTGSTVKVPLSALVTVLRDAHSADLRSQWENLQKDTKRRDRLFVLKDGKLNPLEGTLGAIDETTQTIKFKLEGGADIEPELAKVQALQFARTDLATDPSMCKVLDVDGNLLVATKLVFTGKQLDLVTSFGQKVTLDPKIIAKLDFNIGRLTFLSDLEAKMPDAILLGGFNPLRKDTNLDGHAIMLQDKKYEKGLSMYAGVQLEYGLTGRNFKKFNALLGVDSRIAEEGQGKVTVTIYCDNEKRGSHEVSVNKAIPISIPVSDVNTLRIVVSGSNFTNYSGHATLANAHLSQ